jgi:hypothetical protein
MGFNHQINESPTNRKIRKIRTLMEGTTNPGEKEAAKERLKIRTTLPFEQVKKRKKKRKVVAT